MQALGKLLGEVLYLGLPFLRRITCRNLRFIHPHWPQERVRRFARRVFRHFGITLVETAHMACLSPAQCLQRIHVDDVRHLVEALKQDRGTIIVSAHLGNWEAALQALPLYFETQLLCVAKPLRYGLADRWLMHSRTRFGNKMIRKKGASSKMLETLRQGGSVGLMIDMSRQKQSVQVSFMGHKATASAAAAMLALRSNSLVIPVTCIRAQDGRLRVQAAPAISMRRTSDLRADL